MADRITDVADAYAWLGRFSTQAIGGAMGCAIRGGIVRDYVRNYLREHGRFPTGRHLVRGTFQGNSISFDTLFPDRTIAALAAFGHPMSREELWGSSGMAAESVFKRARKLYLESTDRAWLRRWLRGQIREARRRAKARDGR